MSEEFTDFEVKLIAALSVVCHADEDQAEAQAAIAGFWIALDCARFHPEWFMAALPLTHSVPSSASGVGWIVERAPILAEVR